MDPASATGSHLTILDRVSGDDSPESPQDGATRGVAWVLRWAAALAILYFSGCVLTEFAYCLAAEQTLARAVRAGALEAILPRATRQSVAAAVASRLVNYQDITRHAQLVVRQNGTPLRDRLQPQPGDRLAVSIATPTRSVMPRWLQSLKIWGSADEIVVSAERQMPSRALETRRPAVGTVRGRESRAQLTLLRDRES